MNRRKIVWLMAGVTLLAGQLPAAELKTQDQRYSYTLGVRMAKMLKAQGIGKLDGLAFGEAVADVINGDKLQLSDEEMTETLKLRTEQARKERDEKAAKALEAGKKFLAENAAKPGIKVLDSGLQYQVLKAGGGEPPKLSDKVKVHYEGRLIDGTKFDSSYDRGQPASFSLQGVIKGFREALSHMKPGAKWKVFLPPELGYGKRGAGSSIGPNETLIFEMELLEVIKSDAPETAK